MLVMTHIHQVEWKNNIYLIYHMRCSIRQDQDIFRRCIGFDIAKAF